MRPYIIGALAATLIGCTWVAPQQAQQVSLMSYEAPGAPQTDLRKVAKTRTAIAANKKGHRHRRKAHIHERNAKSNAAPNISSPVQLNDKSKASINAKSTVAAKTETPQPPQPDSASNATSAAVAKTGTVQSQPDDKLDPVIRKALPSIAAKMENSVSVELVEMKRAEKNASGQSIDTICGYVRGKTASGAETGERPFLYLVQKNEAYIGGYNMATSPYHDLCRQ